MNLFTKESLQQLRGRVDLVDLLSSHLDLKRSGPSFKALCPFHEEKSPSFVVQRGDTHYHCFGCGAHGDAIQFLMQHLKMSFVEAVESLASRFHVQLQQAEGEEKKGPNKAVLKEIIEKGSRFYHAFLLHTEEGHEALNYLYQRGIDLDFIRYFCVGLAPKAAGLLRKAMHGYGYSDEQLMQVGLLACHSDGKVREFFSERITFPIRESSGAVIGFSARKYKETTFGGKYINTTETALFKKSTTLFGLNYSRKRIAKERKAIIVEGQIDALRLIQEGFDLTVAGLGTAFGEGHIQELLKLGVNKVYLAFDSDKAGQEAAFKVGNLFQKQGVEVYVVVLPVGMDPDLFLKERGPQAFVEVIENSSDYLSFLVKSLSLQFNLDSPAAKTEVIHQIAGRIKEWSDPVMVHESLRKLSRLMQVPEEVVGVEQEIRPHLYIKRSATLGETTIDPDRILEMDFLRGLLLFDEKTPRLVEIARKCIQPEHLKVEICRQVYESYLRTFDEKKAQDLLSLAIELNDAEGQLLISEILQKRVNRDRSEEHLKETAQRILDREWMRQREEIRLKIHSGGLSEEEILQLAKQFDALKKNPPKVNDASSSRVL